MRWRARATPLAFATKPSPLQVNWGHPLADRLVRAVVYSEASQGSASSGVVRDLVKEQLVTNNSPVIDDVMGSVCRSTGSANAGYFVDEADLTPPTGAGSGGWTIASGVYIVTNSAANQIAHKYQTSHLEWVHGMATSLLYYWLYDNTAGAYIGRTAPVPTAAVWHNICATWDGSAAASGVRIWVDGLRVDDTDFASGVFVQVRDRDADVQIAGSNAGLGGTTDMRFSYVYLFRRGLLPDEVAWLSESPFTFLTQPYRRLSAQGASGAASRFFF